MSIPASEPVALHLIDREFFIACAPEEREGLLEASSYLDRKMRELRANAKSPGFDRLAVLAAISITHEFLALRKQHTAADPSVTEGIAALRRKLEDALDAHVK
jgi:cell division protein ZapA